MARALVGTEGTCAIVAARHRPPGATAARPLPAGAWLRRRHRRRGGGAGAADAKGPSRSESLSAELLALAACLSRRRRPAGGRRLAAGRGRRRRTPAEARDHAARLAAAIGRALDASDVRLHRDGGRAGGPVAHPRGRRRARVAARRTASLPGPASRIRRCRRSDWPATCATLRPCSATTACRPSPTATSARAASTCGSASGWTAPGGEERFGRFMEAAADLVVAHGGSLSGEHGDGRARGALLERQFSPRAAGGLRRASRTLWDPAGVLNPGIIVEPPPVTRDLRATTPAALDVEPAQAYSHDGGDFRAAVERCIGVGRCVSTQGSALMCPSFRATARRAALHARPGAAAPGDDGRQPGRGRLALRLRCARRSTSACPAGAASRSAPPAWTWPPTSRSSCTTTTGAGCGRCRTTRWAGCPSGCD